MSERTVVVLTAAYNRAGQLKLLFESLCQQTDKVFRWLIVDDGSTDDTKQVVEKFRLQSNFNITYIYKENGGKHTALNVGLDAVREDIVIIEDSDDRLVINAIASVKQHWDRHWQDENIGLMLFEYGDLKKKATTPLPRFERTTRYYQRSHGFFGDFGEAYRASAIKRYRLPVFKGERFISEGPLHYEFSKRFDLITVPEVLSYGEYLPEGLTNNIRKMQVKNPKGTMFEASLSFGEDTPLKFKLKKAILFQYVKFHHAEDLGDVDLPRPPRFISVMATPMAGMLYLKDKVRSEKCRSYS